MSIGYKFYMRRLFIITSTILFSCSSTEPIREGILPEIEELPSEFDQVDVLSGKIINYEWKSTFLNETRSITTYLPPNYNEQFDYGVLFVTDGVSISLAHFVEALIKNEEIVPIIIVGVNLREVQPEDSIFGEYVFDFRNLEFFNSEEIFVYKKTGGEFDENKYSTDFDENPKLLTELGFEEVVSRRYIRFTSYLVGEVIPFVKSEYSVSPDFNDWSLGGSSSGGAFVFNFTCDFPGTFGNAVVMSPAGPFNEYNFTRSNSKYFLCAGSEESFLKESLNYIPEMERLGIWYTHKTYKASHDWRMWLTFYTESIKYIYQK